MPKRFCVNTKGLNPKERKEFATDFNEFVADKKAEFKERRDQESQESGDDE